MGARDFITTSFSGVESFIAFPFMRTFFFFAGAPTGGESAERLSPGAFRKVPSCLFFLPLGEKYFACLGVCLSHRRVEWEIFENEMLPSHHLFGQPPLEYVEYVRLGLLGNQAEILRGEKRFTAPLIRHNFK